MAGSSPSALWDKLRRIRWQYLDALPTPVADVMIDAANWIEAAEPRKPMKIIPADPIIFESDQSSVTEEMDSAERIARLERQLLCGLGNIEGTNFIRVDIDDLRAALADQPPQHTGLTAEEEAYAKREIAEACRWHDEFGIASDAPSVGPTDVERVAKAIGEVERSQCGGYPYEGDNPDLNPWLTDKHRMFARAAIAAMPQQPVHVDEVERVAEVIAPHLRQSYFNPDTDDQAEARAFAMSLARKAIAALLVSDRSGVESALRAARPIVEADLEAARDQKDADWEGMSAEALRKIDAVLNDTEGPEERFREALAAIKDGHPNPIALARTALDTPTKEGEAR